MKRLMMIIPTADWTRHRSTYEVTRGQTVGVGWVGHSHSLLVYPP